MRVVFLLLYFCLQAVFLSAQNAPSQQAYLVKLNYVDPENAYNSNFHRVQSVLVETEGLQSFLFVEEQNAFIVRAGAALSVTDLRTKTGGELEIHALPANDYQRLWNQQYSLKLALRKGKGAPADASFPKYVASGNDSRDQSQYREQVIRWLQDHPNSTPESTTVTPTNQTQPNIK